MSIGLIGRKVGVTQVFQGDGTMVAVSVLAIQPNTVTRLRTDERNDVRGLVRLRDLVVHTPALEQPALAWKRLTVWLEPLDVQARRATIGAVELAGLSVVVDPKSRNVLPLLDGKAPDAPAEEASPPPATETEPKSAPWHWLVRQCAHNGERHQLFGKLVGPVVI